MRVRVEKVDVFGWKKSQEIFREHKILIVKEEGNTSQVWQAYYQWVEKSDKHYLRHNLHMVWKALGASINQYHLIKLVANAQMKLKKKEWVKSFIHVNIHPKFWLPFNEQTRKIENNGVLELGKQFLKEKGLYYTMPAFWRHM